jgi:diaminopimelate decarboxylase
MQSKDLLQLAETFGAPLYVYDAEKIASQYNRLTKAFSKVENLKINYAMKALSNVSILQLLKEMGSGLDTVSIQEVLLGLHVGYEADKIFFTPNGVSLEEIEAVAEMGGHKISYNTSLHPHQSTCYGGWQ